MHIKDVFVIAAAVSHFAAAIFFAGPAHAGTVVAVVGPKTGPFAERTREIETGTKKALSQLSKETAADIVIETFDDACDDAKAAGIARALVARKVSLVLGHPCTGAALAAAGIYGPSETVFIATATRHPLLTAMRSGPAVFRLSGLDGKQGAAAARFMLWSDRSEKIAIIHDRTQYAKAIAEQAVEALKANKSSPVTATVVAGDKEYDRLIAKIKDADTVFFAGFPLEAGFILKALRRSGSEARLIISDSAATDEFTQSFGDIALGVTALLPVLPDPQTGSDLNADALAAHAALEVYAHAIATAQSSPRKMTILEAVSNGWHPSVIGLIRFGDDGNASVPDYATVKWNGAAWAPVEAAQR